MSTQTPEAPATPVALALSPALWQLNVPDRFDSYSAGVTLLQMSPTLRSDNNLIAFRRTLEENGESLTDWRNKLPKRVTSGNGPDAEGFAALDVRPRRLGAVQVAHVQDGRSGAATGARLSRFVQGRNPVVSFWTRCSGARRRRTTRRRAVCGRGWCSASRRAGRTRGGVTDAAQQLPGGGRDRKTKTRASTRVRRLTLAKYGVERTVRRSRREPGGDKKRARRARGRRRRTRRARGRVQPDCVINDNLQKLTNRD